MRSRKASALLEVTSPSGEMLIPEGLRPLTGFTLIETLIYLALFSIVIGGGLVAVYGIISGSEANFNKAVVEEESNFLLRKIEWALTGASSIDSPPAGSSSLTLSVTKSDFPAGQNPVVFDVSGSTLRLRRGTGEATPLNTANAAVSKVSFIRLAATGTKPEAVTATFTLTDQGASETSAITKYLRQ